MAVIRHINRFFYMFKLIWTMRKLKRSKGELDKQIVRQKITEQLAKNGGLARKVGQVIANYKKDPAFQQLLKGIPQRKLSTMKSQFAANGQYPSLEDFEWMDEKATASLGQVHKARKTDKK
jgi:predicted unusual protein kinase regulating ubiquinone biosynthesis (AarF/ABC1/UbiB family)